MNTFLSAAAVEPSLEQSDKKHLVCWYCALRAGTWPKSFPYAKPAEWDRMSEVQRAAIPAVIELKKIVTTRYRKEDLAMVYHVLGFDGHAMSASEVQEWWENGGFHEWEWRPAA